MNYVFKMIAVVLVLGVLVLQGCQTSGYSTTKSFDYLNNTSDKQAVEYACSSTFENLTSRYVYKKLIEKRGLDCSYGNSKNNVIGSKSNLNKLTNNYIHEERFINADNITVCKYSNDAEWIAEARRRGLDCSAEDKKTSIVSKNNNIDITTATCALMPSMMSCRFVRKSGIELCESIKGFKRGVETYDNYSGSLKEAKRRGLNCEVGSKNQTITASKSKTQTQTYTKPKSNITSAELDAANKKARELERKLIALENKQKQEQQKIDTDTRLPFLEIISIKTKGKRGTITGIARDNIEVAEVTVDGKPVSLSSNGNFKYSTYVPATGLELKIQVTDMTGLTSSKVVVLKADTLTADSSISFDRLNPLDKRVRNNKDALALIVGVSSYENTKAKALYADNDAMVFKDYATEKLGISENRIKILLNDGADERDILLSVQEWLRRSAKPNQSDIYVFFAGHGLASQDGKNMYLLPHDGSPRLLDDTAILRDRLFADLKSTNPKSVTVFLDTCYSGVTRNEEMLIAGRPIVIKAKEQAIPDGFTLFSAASNEQISRPLEEAKHGMFSYFLMKGMEGNADTNKDNKITARELHAYVEQNVVQQSSGSQTPELQGDKDRVLVQFN